MDDRPTGLVSGLRRKLVASPTRPRGLGLSWRLLLLTALFVMASEVLIYVPSIANFRSSWLADRLTMADTAALVIVGGDATEVPRRIQNDLLAAVGATAIAVRNGATSRLIATVDMPPNVEITADLRMMNPVSDIVGAFGTLLSPSEHILRVIGVSRSGAQIELVMGDRALRAAMLRYSARILWLSALI